LKQNIMKKITSFLSLSFFVASAVAVPLAAQAKPLFGASPKTEQILPSGFPDAATTGSASGRMMAYKDCVNVHSGVNGADFNQVNKFCACVADQSIQGGSGSLSECATASGSSGTGEVKSSGGGGGMMSVIGEVAPSVITGVMEGFSNRSSSRSGGGGLLGGGGGLFGSLGGLLGGGGGGFNIKDLLKNRL
jgi:hypothetical protein